jgi:hypothetical protein
MPLILKCVLCENRFQLRQSMKKNTKNKYGRKYFHTKNKNNPLCSHVIFQNFFQKSRRGGRNLDIFKNV